VLIYEVSRWRRFQDSDDSAYYEFACHRVGMTIACCAEPFFNDGWAMGAMTMSLKRAMAAEYSRELSTKVSLARCRFVIGRKAACLSVRRRSCSINLDSYQTNR
jgi:DNA invertase Pin-like site-specific DNA recombinase